MTATLGAEDLRELGEVLIAAVRVGAVVSHVSLSKAAISVQVNDPSERAMLAWDLDCTRREDDTGWETFTHATGDTVVWGAS